MPIVNSEVSAIGKLGPGGEEQGPGEGRSTGPHQDRLLAEPLEQHAGRDRHHPVRDEEREREEAREREAQRKAADDVGHQRAQDVGDERDHEEDEEHQQDDGKAALHAVPSSGLLRAALLGLRDLGPERVPERRAGPGETVRLHPTPDQRPAGGVEDLDHVVGRRRDLDAPIGARSRWARPHGPRTAPPR